MNYFKILRRNNEITFFIPKEKNVTFGEMKPFQKYKIDHRFKAFKKIKKFF